MKYICLGYMDENIWESMTENERNRFMDECLTYDDELRKSGHMVGGEGLGSYRNATTIRSLSGDISVTDGPFTETKEQLGGILILEARDMNIAIQLMSKHPTMLLADGSWEIRQAADMDSIVEESVNRRSTNQK